jgi:hypothetical protein
MSSADRRLETRNGETVGKVDDCWEIFSQRNGILEPIAGIEEAEGAVDAYWKELCPTYGRCECIEGNEETIGVRGSYW